MQPVATQPRPIEWRSIARQEYPPSDGSLVWMAYLHCVEMGSWNWKPGTPLVEGRFEDEEGNDLLCDFWCPLEDSPTGRPLPPVPRQCQSHPKLPVSEVIANSAWRSLYHYEFPSPLVPIWVANNGDVQPALGWWDIPYTPPSAMIFTSPDGVSVQGQFWAEMDDEDQPPPVPTPEMYATIPADFVFGDPPEPVSQERSEVARSRWQDFLQMHAESRELETSEEYLQDA